VGVLSPSNSFAKGPGLGDSEAGQVQNFEIYSYDQFENYYPFGNATAKVEFTGPGMVNTSIEDLGNGTYAVSYLTTVSGDYNISITLDDSSIGIPSESKVTIFPGLSSLHFPLFLLFMIFLKIFPTLIQLNPMLRIQSFLAKFPPFQRPVLGSFS